MAKWISVALVGIGIACGVSAQDLDKLAWMSGIWIQKTDKEEVRENWLGPKGNVMVATNLTMTAGRGASFEFLRIGVKDGKIIYFAMPNGRPPTEFTLAAQSDTSVMFENPANAYPTRIIYRRDGDALIARIEGRRQGNDASEEWRFTKAP